MDNAPPLENENEEMFDYVQLEGGLFDEVSFHQLANGENRQQQLFHFNVQKITNKASFSCVRVILLFFFYYIENHSLTSFLTKLIIFLLVHEASVIVNFTLMKIYLIYKHYSIPNSYEFPSGTLVINTLNNFIFFVWFIYGNICILTDRQGVEDSLNNNVLTTYYITVLILFGFFIFSKLIFYVIFFISFCPCITYMFWSDLREEYNTAQRAKQLQENLKKITYEEYSNANGTESNICIICTEDFKMKDVVIELPCNNM